MGIFLVMQATYAEIESGLFGNTGDCIEQRAIPKQQASQRLALTIHELLSTHGHAYTDCQFIGASVGPAPFTTLRTLIATINGIALATHVPLVGVDGLKSLLAYTQTPSSTTIALLNAYHHDVYYAYDNVTGCAPIDTVLKIVAQHSPPGPLVFVGNGVTVYEAQIREQFADRTFTLNANIDHAPLATTAALCLNEWRQGKATTQLCPLYLKSTILSQTSQNPSS